MFTFNSTIHQHNTRSSNNLHRHKITTNARNFTLRFHGPIVWNNLPNYLKSIPDINVFKIKMKCFILAE